MGPLKRADLWPYCNHYIRILLIPHFRVYRKNIGFKRPFMVSQSEFVKMQTSKLSQKMIKNWSQAGSSILQTKQASQARCRSNYLKAIAVNAKVYHKPVQIQNAMIL